MAIFTDKKGREWIVKLDYDSITRCRQRGIDPINVITVDVQESVACQLRDPIWIVNALMSLCEEQIKERKLDTARFGKAVIAVRAAARDALEESMLDFFQMADMEAEANVLKDATAEFNNAEVTLRATNEPATTGSDE